MDTVALALTEAVLAASCVYGLALLPAAPLALLGAAAAARGWPSAVPLLVLLNVAYWMLSLLWSPARLDEGFLRWQLRAVAGLAPLLGAAAYVARPDRLRRGLVLLLASATFVVAIGIVQYALGHVGVAETDFEVSPYAVRRLLGQDWFMGFFRSHSAAGGYFGMVFVVASAWLVLGGTGGPRPWPLAAAAGMNLWALLFTKSRLFLLASVVVLVAALAVAAWLVARRRMEGRQVLGRSAPLALACATAVVLGHSFVLDRVAFLTRPVSTEAAIRAPGAPGPRVAEAGALTDRHARRTVIERFGHFRAALAIWKEHPLLGAGFGAYPLAIGRHIEVDTRVYPRPQMLHGHNTLLHVAAETGLGGLVLFLLLLVALARNLARGLRERTPGTDAFALAAVPCLVLGMMLLASLADHVFASPTLVLPAMSILALAGGAESRAGGARVGAPGISDKIRAPFPQEDRT